MEKEGNNLFQVNLKGMIALLSEHIYSNPNTFVRELLQNCVDAITALRNIDENYKGRIDVFLNEDKTVVFSNLSVCFGCTGGQHRSVYSAQHLAEHLNQKFGVKVELVHREQNIEHTFEATI